MEKVREQKKNINKEKGIGKETNTYNARFLKKKIKS